MIIHRVPDGACIFKDWAYEGFVALQASFSTCKIKVSLKEKPYVVGLGTDYINVSIPSEAFGESYSKVFSFIDFFQITSMDVVGSIDSVALVGKSYDLALVGMELHLPLFLPAGQFV